MQTQTTFRDRSSRSLGGDVLRQFIRSREITDILGGQSLVLTLQREGPASLVTLHASDKPSRPIMLSTHGVELLSTYLTAASAAMPHGLAPEYASDNSGLTFTLVHEAATAKVLVSLDGSEAVVGIPEYMWGQLSAELMLTASHIRALDHP